MKTNSFLTDIAKKYNSKIEYVALCDLEDNLLGEVQRRESFEAYRILIDQKKLPCIYSTLFTLFHELGHISLNHLGFMKRHYKENQNASEKEADVFAFNQMGLIDEQGQTIEKHKICYECHKTRSRTCLKELNSK